MRPNDRHGRQSITPDFNRWYSCAQIEQLKAKRPAILLETRQRGLMMGIKLADEQLGPLLSLAGLHHGLLTVYANNDTSVNQILPPLIISEAEARQVLASLDAMLGWVGEMVGMVR